MRVDDTAPPTRHRVVIVGGGFGGVRAARGLRREPVDITLVDRTNHHLFQPLLYQVATGILSPGQIAPALRSLFRRQRNVRVVLGSVEHIDLAQREVEVVADRARVLAWDSLIVAAGATHSYFGNDQWADLAPGMKTLDDANRLRSRILGAFELAEQVTDPAERSRWLTFCVIGAGPTGVELAGQIAVLAHRILPPEFRTIDTRQARVLLLDAAPTVLGAFAARSQQRAARDLERLGVEVQTGAKVVDVTADGVRIEVGEERRDIAARTVVWAAGVAASPLGRQLAAGAGIEIDRSGRVPVCADCSLPSHPDVFVIGDMAALPGVPGVAQPAMQEGAYVAQLIARRLRGRAAPGPFRYHDKGSMATIGRTRAVAEIGRLQFGGFAAFLVWGVVHLAYLVGWGNRSEAVLRWMWTLLARNRRERLISIVSLVSSEHAREHVMKVLPRQAGGRADADGHGLKD